MARRALSVFAYLLLYGTVIGVIIFAIKRYDKAPPPQTPIEPPIEPPVEEPEPGQVEEAEEVEELPTMEEEANGLPPDPEMSPPDMLPPNMNGMPPEPGMSPDLTPRPGMLPAPGMPPGMSPGMAEPGNPSRRSLTNKFVLVDSVRGTIQHGGQPLTYTFGPQPQIHFLGQGTSCFLMESYSLYGFGSIFKRYLTIDGRWVLSAIRVGQRQAMVHLTPNRGLQRNQMWEKITSPPGNVSLARLRLLRTNLYMTRTGPNLMLRFPKGKFLQQQQFWLTPYAC